MSAPLTLGAWLDAAGRTLSHAGIDGARREARLIAGLVLGRPAGLLETRTDIETAARARLDAALARRAGREPLSRIRGAREFWGRDFLLSPATLDPRPETETLVEAALARIAARDRRDGPLRILDLGTGSGCILVTLVAELPQATGVGTDLAPQALSMAEANARRHGVIGRARFVLSDWLARVEGTYHMIVANPPYIRQSDLARLEPEVSAFDPRLALDGGRDGLDAHRAILAAARTHLEPGGDMLLEIGAGQEDEVAALVRRGLPCEASAIAMVRDLGGHIRVVTGTTHCAAQHEKGVGIDLQAG